MKTIYIYLYKIFSCLKVASPVISAIYAFLWFFEFCSISLPSAIVGVFNFFADFVKTFWNVSFSYQEKLIDMTYIICAGLFVVFYYVFKFLEARTVDLYEIAEEISIKQKSMEEKRVNKSIEKNLAKELKEFSKFSLLLNIKLKFNRNIVAEDKDELKILQKKYYSYVVKHLDENFRSTRGIVTGKLFIVIDNFNCFDKLIFELLELIKKIRENAAKKNIMAEFIISVDALKTNYNAYNASEMLEKIDSFNYRNKVIATSSFKVRYDLNEEKSFRAVPIGVSRFFNGPDDFVDFDLFTIKRMKED